ncbi:hypothetical protein RHGRI_006955 [Rhododendron griersonianum]|uniref:Uncharacterized protein n=1 Tax=Rhododendron griersonianum TaxID=479676 RepID=A0AAV6KV63_9ERIC|nr:hypothetical protein RHGRI_006955 [Rhododendron griersonianum]
MALPTLYLSSGRTLLVTPHTSFLANNYMKMHQPGFRHERVVVEGFGHSDLLIGEECHSLRVYQGGAYVAVPKRVAKYARDDLTFVAGASLVAWHQTGYGFQEVLA